jgi:hypothetical protein
MVITSAATLRRIIDMLKDFTLAPPRGSPDKTTWGPWAKGLVTFSMNVKDLVP